MVTHLAVIPKQVTATDADRFWPTGTRLQADRLRLYDLYVGYRAAEGDKSISLAKKLLKWVRSRFNYVWHT